MTSNFSQAIKVIGKTRLSLQQAISKQTAARIQLSESDVGKCITPPAPTPDGTWTTIHPTKVGQKEDSVASEMAEFPGKLPFIHTPGIPTTTPPHHM